MNSQKQPLPPAENLNIAALSRIFQNTSTSYKFLFFLAILNKLDDKYYNQHDDIILDLQDLAVEMAILSWYPIKFYKLSFGWQDQVANIIDRLEFDPNYKAITSKKGQEQLRTAIKQQAKEIGLFSLLRFVPYRLQSVFFSAELKGVPEKRKNDLISELTCQYNSPKNPLYQFVDHNNLPSIRLTTKWVKYLLADSNIVIVKDWALWCWVSYLQKRNPNTPAIINKVLPPIKRSSLNTQTDFWNTIIDSDPSFECIYTGERLVKKSFSLDHFLPWTFVCHDQPWNLCPVVASANSSKGNRLPDEKYFDNFVEQQHKALKIGSKIMIPKKWDKLIESYVMDLRITEDELLNESNLSDAFEGLLKPMLSIAKQTGFEKDWVYRPN